MSELSIEQLSKRIDVPEVASFRAEDLVSDFMTAAIMGLADGDFIGIHEKYTGRKAELYGESNYNEGVIAQNIARAALDDGMTPGVMYDFQDYAAQYFTLPGNPLRGTGFKNPVSIHANGILTVSDNVFALTHEPHVVFDFGACLSGRSFLHDQVRLVQEGRGLFTYAPLTRLHFTNQALIYTYNTFQDGFANLMINNGLYKGREDGIDTATSEIIKAQTAHNASTEIADVVVCAGSHHSTPDEIESGIKRAHSLLAEEGVLVIKALSRPATDELGADKIAEWAFETGFHERNATEFETAITSPGVLLSSGHFGAREMKTIIISK